MSAVIREFQGRWRFLSNFQVVGATTVEHEYQASKTLSPEWINRILAAPTPGQAKRLGSRAPLRSDWEQVRVPIMPGLLRWKFSEHPDLQRALLSTGDAILEEGNAWGDRFWGISPVGSGQGKNILGRLLMQVRSELS